MSSLGIVAPEVVRNDVAIWNIVAQADVDGDWTLGSAAVLFAQDADLSRIVGTAQDDVGDSLFEHVGGVQVEQLGGLSGHAADVAPGGDPAFEEDVDLRRDGAQTVTPRRRSGAPFAPQNLGAVLGVLDLLAMAPRAGVVRYHVGSVENTDGAIVGDEGQGTLDVIRGDGIQIGVEASECGLVDEGGLDQVGLGHGIWQRKQPLLFLDETLADLALGKIGMHPLVGDLLKEDKQLAVALLDVIDVATCEEAVTQKPDPSFDATFLVPSIRTAQPQLNMQGAREVDDAKKELAGILEEQLEAQVTIVDWVT
ncbi:MAG: hypothetical protein ABJA82_08305, partial [Myxococcales bacterium]